MRPRARAADRRPSVLVAVATVLAATVVATVGVVVAPPALAQQGGLHQADELDPAPLPDDELDDGLELTVTHLTGVLGPGAHVPDGADSPPTDLELRVLVENVSEVPIDALQVAIEIHPAVTSRSRLRRALEGRIDTQPLHVRTPALNDGEALGPGELTGATDRFEDAEVAWSGAPGGVHPIRLAVTRGTEVLAEATTAVVWLAEEPTDPLIASLVLPIDAPPWRAAGGSYSEAADRDIRPGGRLDVLLTAVETTDAAVVLAPAAHLLEDLGDRSDGFPLATRRDDGVVEVREVPADDPEAQRSSITLRRIREIADELPFPPAASTYADADLDALADSGGDTRDLAATAATTGRQRTQLQLGTDVDPATHLAAGPIGRDVLDLLPGDTVLLPPSALEDPGLADDPDLGEPVRRLQAPAGRVLTGLLADPYLAESLAEPTHPGGPLLAAHRTVAESAMAYLSSPGTADRALVLLPPRTWSPSPQVADELLTALDTAPWLRLTSTGRVASEARRSTQSVEFRGSEHGSFPSPFVADLTAALEGLAGVTAALEEVDDPPDGRSPQLLEDDLLRATSRWYRGTGDGDALVRDVQRAIDATFGDVEVTTGAVTLTSDTGQVPITLQRTRGGPLQVRVDVRSGGGLVWPEDRVSDPLVLEEGASQTVSFPTQAQSTGTFPVTVRVTDPSGTYELSSTTMSVHSRAISGPALASIGGVIGVLLLFGALRRRDRGEHDPPAERPAASGAGGRLKVVSPEADAAGQPEGRR